MKASVPRNTVYNEYQYLCGDLRVSTLNPASFGKLVRIIFPNITTRRLGVRGNSKYHYVDLALKGANGKLGNASRGRAASIVNQPPTRPGTAQPGASKYVRDLHFLINTYEGIGTTSFKETMQLFLIRQLQHHKYLKYLASLLLCFCTRSNSLQTYSTQLTV